MVITDLSPQNLRIFYDCFEELMREGYNNFSARLQDYFLYELYSLRNFSFWLERKVRKILLSVEDEKVNGFIVGDHTFGGVGFVTWLGVAKDKRNEGIGSKLMQEYEEYILTKKAHLLELYTFEHVKSFYESHGFQEVGRRKVGYFGQKNIIMNKTLGEWDENTVPKAYPPFDFAQFRKK